MAERRRFKRIPVYLRIKEIDQNPKSDGTLVNISALGAQIETTTKYRCGNLIKFSYIPSGPSLNDLEIQERGGAIWNIPADMFREELLSGKVVWVAPHPDKPNHFLMGIKFSPKKTEWATHNFFSNSTNNYGGSRSRDCHARPAAFI